MTEPDDADDLAGWIRQHPEVWDFAWADDGPDLAIDTIVEKVIRERSGGRWHHRRRSLLISLASAAVVGGTAVAAAALWSTEPSRPESGTACRSAPSLGSSAIALEPGVDPVSGCARLWADGAFSASADLGPIPELVACIDPRGPINVFPGPADLCARLHLAPADPAASSDAAAVVSLQDRLAADINLASCRGIDEVVAQAREILEQSRLVGWQVVISPGSESAVCAKAGVDSTTRTVTIFEF